MIRRAVEDGKGGMRWRAVGKILSAHMDPHTRLLFLLVLLIFLMMSLSMPKQFPTRANLESMAFQMSEVGILSVAMALAMLIGGIDLSITATANLSAIAAGLVLTRDGGPGPGTAGALPIIVLAFVTALAVGLACGLVNGLLIGRVGVPAILATLSTLMLYTGLAYGVTRGRAVHGFPGQVLFLGSGRLFGIPLPLLVFLTVLAVVSLVLNRTAFGFKVYMLGSNPTAARFSGIENPKIILKTHVIASLLSAVTGIVILARTNSANADYGSSYILMTILITVFGGVAVTGGSGRLGGVAMALVVLQMLSTGFNMLLLRFSGSNFFRDFAWGLLLLVVMVWANNENRSGIRHLCQRVLMRR